VLKDAPGYRCPGSTGGSGMRAGCDMQVVGARFRCTPRNLHACGAHRRLKLSGSFMMSTSRRPAVAGSLATSATCAPGFEDSR
jgi:hypothetical protein